MNWQTVLLIVHGLFAVALLGAITHQAAAVLAPGKPAGAAPSSRASAPCPALPMSTRSSFSTSSTAVLGGVLYTEYRVGVRTVVEQLGMWPAHGAFELKEHFAAVGLGLLPAYWYYWRFTGEPRTRAALTAFLAVIVWWNFLVGHVLNNIRGFGV